MPNDVEIEVARTKFVGKALAKSHAEVTALKEDLERLQARVDKEYRNG